VNENTALVQLNDTMQLGKILAESGFFQDSRSASQAVVKVLAGRELGFGPVAAMTGINIIQGRVSLSANIMAAAVKRSGRYNFRVREMTEAACKIEFFERSGDKWETIGVSTFTAADARKAGTKNMDKYPRNMLYARAISNGVRWFCPDVLGGSPVYTPEELGAQVNEDGQVIDVTVSEPEPVHDEGLPVKLVERYAALTRKAVDLGLEVEEITDGMTSDEVVEMGKALKARIEIAQHEDEGNQP